MKDGTQSHPKSIDLRRYLILAYLKTGDEHLAINQIDEILKIRPNDIISLLQLAKLKEKQGNFKESLESYKKIVDISPDHEEAEEAYLRVLLQLAKFEEERGNFKEALEYNKKIMDISPGHSPDHEEAEEAYLRLRLKVLPTEKDRQ